MLASHETPMGSLISRQDSWVKQFGVAEAPISPWRFVTGNGCMFGLQSPALEDNGKPMKKGIEVMANFDVSVLALSCRAGVISPLSRQSLQMKPPTPQVAAVDTESPPLDSDSDWEELPVQPGASSGTREGGAKMNENLTRAEKIAAGTRAAPAGPPPTPVLFMRAGGHAVAEQGDVVGQELDPADSEVVFAPDPPSAEAEAELSARGAALREESRRASSVWLERARRGEWHHVQADMEVYRFLGELKLDPRLNDECRDGIISDLGLHESSRFPHLSEHDFCAAREVYRRCAPGLWHEGSPRTTIRAFVHDTVTIGAPIRSAPIRLKGDASQFVEDAMRDGLLRGQYERGTSPWDSWVFPTRPHPSGRKRRVVVDYRRVNQRTVRAVYHLRRADDLKVEALGSTSLGYDAVAGFNQVQPSGEFSPRQEGLGRPGR